MTTNKVCGKGKCKFTDEFCASGDCPYDTENVAQRNSQDLTEQWKKGELEEYKKYYCKTKWFEDIFQARCYSKNTEDEWWALENEKYKYNNIYHTKNIEVLAPVPSYEGYKDLKSHDEKATIKLGEKIIENYKLKELLTDICCELVDDEEDMTNGLLQYFNTDVIDRIREALK